ncbi:MAG TPA: GNAT family N-acetyltransferase [Candidatus Acidoferrales bacterium]|nr:GNAT family N-acetyltransferase [Candidatus Acidoferrales bacterium]
MTRADTANRVVIRPATIEDSPRLAPLSGQLGYPSTSSQVESRMSPILADPEHVIFVAEQSGGEISGWADVFIMHTIGAEPRAEIAGLVVDESCRSQGIGRLLMARVEEWARAKGCAAVSLRSNVIRERAHKFYEQLGYQLIKTQKSFRKTL